MKHIKNFFRFFTSNFKKGVAKALETTGMLFASLIEAMVFTFLFVLTGMLAVHFLTYSLEKLQNYSNLKTCNQKVEQLEKQLNGGYNESQKSVDIRRKKLKINQKNFYN